MRERTGSRANIESNERGLTPLPTESARASGALRLHAAPAVPIKQYNPKFEESFAPEQVLVPPERGFCVDNLLVRIHLIIIRPCAMGV